MGESVLRIAGGRAGAYVVGGVELSAAVQEGSTAWS